LVRASVGYPDREFERRVMVTHRMGEPVNQLGAVLGTDEIMAAQASVREVAFEDSLVDYLLDIVQATRSHDGFEVGVSTRGALSFYRGCQARAITEGRDFVTPDDIKQLAVPVLAHRVLPEGIFQGANRRAVEQQVADVIEQVPVPV